MVFSGIKINNAGLIKFSFVIYSIGLIILLNSCGTTKRAQSLNDNINYKIRQLHMEARNSTYDNLAEEYMESLKPADIRAAEAFARDTLAHMEKTACFDDCPIYRITIFNGGGAKYEGIDNVEMKGIFESKLEEAQKVKLNELVDAIELLKMYNRYPRGITVKADLQMTKMVLSDGTYKFPTIINYGAPPELENIELYLEQLIKELSWVQI